jgi:hypothetical protein
MVGVLCPWPVFRPGSSARTRVRRTAEDGFETSSRHERTRRVTSCGQDPDPVGVDGPDTTQVQRDDPGVGDEDTFDRPDEDGTRSRSTAPETLRTDPPTTGGARSPCPCHGHLRLTVRWRGRGQSALRRPSWRCRRLRGRPRRSRSTPPQMPNFWLVATANAMHSLRTGQVSHTACAHSRSRPSPAAGKNRPGSRSRHAAERRQPSPSGLTSGHTGAVTTDRRRAALTVRTGPFGPARNSVPARGSLQSVDVGRGRSATEGPEQRGFYE